MLTPKIFKTHQKVDRPVIVKAYGAKGGLGYLLCPDNRSLKEALKNFNKEKIIIQEYITGTPVYIHFFYSPINEKLEIMGCDRRYESDIDGIGRIPAEFQKSMVNDPSFTVIGNIPIVLRESILAKIYTLSKFHPDWLPVLICL